MGDPMDITGSWKVTGWNVGGDTSGPPAYKGVVQVLQTNAQGCYALTWVVGAAKSQQPGIAVHDAESGTFAAAYVMGTMPGVVHYRPGPTGETLEGRWAMGSSLDKSPGYEEWSR